MLSDDIWARHNNDEEIKTFFITLLILRSALAFTKCPALETHISENTVFFVDQVDGSAEFRNLALV